MPATSIDWQALSFAEYYLWVIYRASSLQQVFCRQNAVLK